MIELVKYLVGLFIALICLILPAQNTALFEQANTLYNQGKYTEAIKKYDAILETQNHSAELYFNIGNAHYKLNHIAPSIYYYEKALLLNPNDADIKNNIAFARNMTIDDVDTIPEIGFEKLTNRVTNTLDFDGWAIASTLFVIGFVILFLVYYFTYSTSRKRLAFITSLVSAFLAIISLAFAFHKYNLDKSNNPAIVFAQEAQIKSEPNLRSAEAFKLHEGTKVEVLDTVNNWRKIKLTDGKTGWVSSEDIKLIKDF